MSNKSNIPARLLIDDKWYCNIDAISESQLVSDDVVDFDYVMEEGAELEWVANFLIASEKNGQHIDVVFTALKYIKENPDLTPSMAMRLAYGDLI